MDTTKLGGPPAAMIARLTRRTAALDVRRADGCGLNTTALPADTIEIALLMIVAAGLVTGVIAPTTPNGANSVIIMPLVPDTAWTSRSSGPGVFVGHEPVLDGLVVHAPEARLLDGEARQRLGLLEWRPAARPR